MGFRRPGFEVLLPLISLLVTCFRLAELASGFGAQGLPNRRLGVEVSESRGLFFEGRCILSTVSTSTIT